MRDRKDMKELCMRIRRVLPRSLGSMYFTLMSRVPRTEETGKVRRGELEKQS